MFTHQWSWGKFLHTHFLFKTFHFSEPEKIFSEERKRGIQVPIHILLWKHVLDDQLHILSLPCLPNGKENDVNHLGRGHWGEVSKWINVGQEVEPIPSFTLPELPWQKRREGQFCPCPSFHCSFLPMWLFFHTDPTSPGKTNLCEGKKGLGWAEECDKDLWPLAPAGDGSLDPTNFLSGLPSLFHSPLSPPSIPTETWGWI